LSGNLGVLDALSEIEQVGAVQLAALSSVKRRRAFAVIEHVLMHGKVEARQAAASALAQFTGEEVNDAAVRAMDDADPQVRAAIAAQLRGKGVLGAIPRLVALLDSPHEAERAAAQASLSEFRFEQFLENFDELTPEAQRNTGRLVRRVDSLAIDGLRQELESPIRGRRIRALKIALALNAAPEVEESIAGLLTDHDQFLRVEAIRTLATADSPFIRQTLRDAMLDTNPLVSEAAESALARLSQPLGAMGPKQARQPITGIGTGLATGDSAKPLTHAVPETVL
jgi:HEAT repeat protein